MVWPVNIQKAHWFDSHLRTIIYDLRVILNEKSEQWPESPFSIDLLTLIHVNGAILPTSIFNLRNVTQKLQMSEQNWQTDKCDHRNLLQFWSISYTDFACLGNFYFLSKLRRKRFLESIIPTVKSNTYTTMYPVNWRTILVILVLCNISKNI